VHRVDCRYLVSHEEHTDGDTGRNLANEFVGAESLHLRKRNHCGSHSALAQGVVVLSLELGLAKVVDEARLHCDEEGELGSEGVGAFRQTRLDDNGERVLADVGCARRLHVEAVIMASHHGVGGRV